MMLPFALPSALKTAGIGLALLAASGVVHYIQWNKNQTLTAELETAKANTKIVVKEVEIERQVSKKELLGEVVEMLNKRYETLSKEEKELVDLYKKDLRVGNVLKEDQSLRPVQEKEAGFNSDLQKLIRCSNYRRGVAVELTEEEKKLCEP